MKKLFLLVLAFCLTISTIGCSPKTVYACLSFSEYYQSAEGFDEISPQLELYFSLIETAYENSDKKKPSSFVLSEEYDEVRDTLRSFHDSLKEDKEDMIQIKDEVAKTDAEQAYMAKLNLLYPYIQIEAILAEQKLMLLVSPNTKNEDWFNELNTSIKDSVREYLIGTGD